MSRTLCLIFTWMLAASVAPAAPKPHVVSFGKWQVVLWFVASAPDKPLSLKVRPLYVDGKLREYTLDQSHEITEHLFVIQRAVRLNDALPGEAASPRLWRWERGGWLMVDRSNGRVSPLSLPEFDPFYSTTTWYRDYAAYCGVSDDGRRISFNIVQLGRRRPLLHKRLENLILGDEPGSGCPTPMWFRQPPRVEFQMPGGQKVTFSLRRRAIEVSTIEGDEESTDFD